MQYRMKGSSYELPTNLEDTDTYELDRIVWLARNAKYNPELQKAAQGLLQEGVHIHTSDRGDYTVIDSHYTVEQVPQEDFWASLDAKDDDGVVEEREVLPPVIKPVVSPSVAINVQGERYYLAVAIQSHTAFDMLRREHRTKQLPTTEEVMVWELQQYNARKQEDGSWSLPPRVTVELLEEILHFHAVKECPIAPEVDPLIKAHEDYSRNISGY